MNKSTMLMELVEKYVDALGVSSSHEEIANRIFLELSTSGDYEELFPCLVSWISSQRRLSQIPLENAAFASIDMEHLESSGLVLDSDNAARWKASMDKEVCVRSSTKNDPGLWKSWAEMTVQDHLDRIEAQEKRISGLRVDQDKHRKAIILIENYKVSCLGEIPVNELISI